MRRFLDWTAGQSQGPSNSNQGVSDGSPRQDGSQSRGSFAVGVSSSAGHNNNGRGYTRFDYQSSSTLSGLAQQSPQHQQIRNTNPSAKDLEAQHLAKLLQEIKYYQASSSPLPSSTAGSRSHNEFIEKVYKTLPLFLDVFTPSSTIQTTTTSISAFNLPTSSFQSLTDQLDNITLSESLPSSKPNSPLPPRSPQMERFPDLLPFAFTVARLFVSEVRQMASNKHAEDASLAILRYVNPKPPQVASGHKAVIDNFPPGWNLILSLNALASSQSTQIIQLLCDASLPSTLVKCLYLFFDLPTAKPPDSSRQLDDKELELDQAPIEDNSSIIKEQVSSSLIRALTQLIVQLCSFQSAIDELIRKDDLRLLIGLASSQCPIQNRAWKKTAFHTLVAISKTMREHFVYLEKSMCIHMYVENIHRLNSLGLIGMGEAVDMMKMLLEFLHNLDANNRNQTKAIAPIMDQFKNSRFLDIFEEILFRIDDKIVQEMSDLSPSGGDTSSLGTIGSHQISVSNDLDELRGFGSQLIQSLTLLAKLNINRESMANIATLAPLSASRFEMLEQFKMPRPSARNCVLNYDALRLLKMAWSRCQDKSMIEAVLDATISLFNDDKFNYFVLESQQCLVYYMTSQNFHLFPYKVKQKLFKFIEFIIIETNYIPCLELGTLGTIIKMKSSSNIDLVLGLRTLIACLRFNPRFSDIFRDIGVLEVIVELLIETMQQSSESLCQDLDKIEVTYLLLEASQHMLAGPNNPNCIQYNESGAARHVFNFISKPEFFCLFAPTRGSSSDDSSQLGPPSRTCTPPQSGRPTRSDHTGPRQWVNNPYLRCLPQSKSSAKQLQRVAFTIIRQLILSSAGDEHLANLLGLLARNHDDLKAFEDSWNEKFEDSNSQRSEGRVSPRPISTAKLDFSFLMSQDINLKICILKSLMIILKDSHRCRTLFRKTGGFLYIISSLVVLENSLPLCHAASQSDIEAHQIWTVLHGRRIWRLIKSSLMTIIMAIRLEPINQRVFSNDILPKFVEAISKLGCFVSSQSKLPELKTNQVTTDPIRQSQYKSIFLTPPNRDFSTIVNETLNSSQACCQIFRFLYDMSLDLGDGTAELEKQLQICPPSDEQETVPPIDHTSQQHEIKSMSFDQYSNGDDNLRESGILRRRMQYSSAPKRPPSLDLNIRQPEPALLTFPSVILAILDLIPSCPEPDLMSFVSLVLKSLFEHERNQQMLCEAGLIKRVLEFNWNIAVKDKTHFLYEVSQFMLHKLSRQSITPNELKMFLRLGDPLLSKSLDGIELSHLKLDQTNGDENRSDKIPIDRINTLVSMMSSHEELQPPFVEFDMSTDGLSSIFMPSIAPVNAKTLPQNTSVFLNSTLEIHTNEKNGILGGLGSSERQFPPISGITFMSWIQIKRFPPRSSDPNHNIRLLTLYRGSAATGKEFSCFKVQISALDRALMISTQESLLFDNETSRSDVHYDPDCNIRIWTPELLTEGRWHHLAITVSRAPQKQGSAHAYVDGRLIHNQRIAYINHLTGATNSGPLGNPAGGGSHGSPAAFVNAVIGSLVQFRCQQRAQWKQGPCQLIEEPLPSQFIELVFALGPQMAGNFQSTSRLQATQMKLKGNRLGDHHNYNAMGQQQQCHPNNHSDFKGLVHQQSAGARSSPSHGIPLTRVSSSGVGIMNNPGSLVGGGGQTSSSSLQSIAEDRVLFSLDVRATSLMTLSRMRRIYTRFDCRQVSRVLGLPLNENATPVMLLHNTSVQLNGASRGFGAVTVGNNNQVRSFIPSPTQETLVSVGGAYVLLGLVAQSQTGDSLTVALKSLVLALKFNPHLQAQMDQNNGYQILAVFLRRKRTLLSLETLELLFSLVTDVHRCHLPIEPQMNSSTNAQFSSYNSASGCMKSVQQVTALCELVCDCFDLWIQTDMIDSVLEFIYNLISSSPSHSHTDMLQPLENIVFTFADSSGTKKSSSVGSSSSIRSRNLKCLRDLDLLPRMLRLLAHCEHQPQVEQSTQPNVNSPATPLYNIKAVYLIRQTVFELLNKTPRQSDILYFGQFLAYLMPSNKIERQPQAVCLRNILLKSLTQMMTKNKQREVNQAIQEELVRILGFDWFMLFISGGSYLDEETITIGFINLMLVLSNDDLYTSFNTKAAQNGGWLKEPSFPTMDGKFNIQLLGLNVGAFFGLNNKKRSVQHEVLQASNFSLLSECLRDLARLPRIYIIIFHTMLGRLADVRQEPALMDSIKGFGELNLSALCDTLMGDTHHKRRQTLANVRLRCHELVICVIKMSRELMLARQSDDSDSVFTIYPVDLTRFLMYLYNNNQEFQAFCRSSDHLIEALSEMLIDDRSADPPTTGIACDFHNQRRPMIQHPATKEVLEFSRLIIIDKMMDQGEAGLTKGADPDSLAAAISTIRPTSDHLHAFELFLGALDTCRSAQGELADVSLRQILLMIDSTARHNSSRTIEASKNVIQFQLLLINSIQVAQLVTDRIWLGELFSDSFRRVLTILEHQMCLAEQVFKFHELLPKSSPAHAFIMQRTLNRAILFGLSRPIRHLSDNILLLDLLKQILDNRALIIVNHMHESPHSADFFVCLTYCLLRIIDQNSSSGSESHNQQPASLIERQFGPSPSLGASSGSGSEQPSSVSLMLVSMAKKVWDAVFQSKKSLLSDSLNVSMSLPAFTLDTSLDLQQLRPDILETCERSWTALLDNELKPRRRLHALRSTDSSSAAAGSANSNTSGAGSGGGSSSAVHLLSGRLTRVVNAANFVSRVVGATAGSVASNVNLVGEKLAQNRAQPRPPGAFGRSPSDLCDLHSGSHQPIHHQSSSAAERSFGGPNTGATNSNNNKGNNVSCPDMFGLANIGIGQVQQAFRTHIAIVEDHIEAQLSQRSHRLALNRYLADEWIDIEWENLLRERALFGPDWGSRLDKWCLDMTEGPRRMRKKMANNTRQFYQNYPYSAEQFNPDNRSLRYRPPMSYDSQEYHLKVTRLAGRMLEPLSSGAEEPVDPSRDVANSPSGGRRTPQPTTEEPVSVDEGEKQTNDTISINIETPSSPTSDIVSAEKPEDSPVDKFQHPLQQQKQDDRCCSSDHEPDEGDSSSFVDFSPEIEAESSRSDSESSDSLSVLRLLEKNERISHMFRCSRVQGLDTHEGLLLFGREHFYLIDGFTLLKTREIKDIDSLSPDAHDPIIPNSTPNISSAASYGRKSCAKFAFDAVVEVHKRRYLLQPIALEVFSSDGRNTLIVFPRNIRNKVYSRLTSLATQMNSNAHESLAGQKSTVSVEAGSGLLSNLIGETSVTQRWVRGELSNFQYLMNLNTIAGRSYNDLMQYPIFPWILADYSSDQLDFTKPSTFRDLSRPVGAQTAERLDQFKRRFADWDDAETPPYHYGTFYSSAMIVASYMVRMEPFTQHFLRLQGGHFDLADRMFHSIHDSWLSASKHNMADIKELIPEFFYLPEFLQNSNRFDLGIKQSGRKLDDVILPPWAKGDPREFIRLHRCALESDYVSAHLHEWIDLIFGHKQQGQAAVDAVNVFHHLFYEGNVDIFNTDIDPIKKNAVIGFINNFGQVPKQLFKRAHPARRGLSGGSGLGVLGGASSSSPSASSGPLTPMMFQGAFSGMTGAVVGVAASGGGGSSAPSGHPNAGIGGPNRTGPLITQSPHLFKPTQTQFKELRGPVGQIIQMDKNLVAAVEQNKLLIPPEFCRYIAWGHADRSLRLGLYDSEKPIFVWEGSDSLAAGETLCCTIPNSRTLITAGKEAVISVWKLEKTRTFAPLLNLYGHVEPVTCLASSEAYSLLVSGSRDRSAIVWDLNKFTYVRQLGGGSQLLHQGPVSAIAINDSTGDIVSCASSWLYLWSINGELLAHLDTLGVTMNQSLSVGNINQFHILTVCFSQHSEWDLDEVVVTGASDGSVSVWSLRYYQQPMSRAEIAAKAAAIVEASRTALKNNEESSTVADSLSAENKSDDQLDQHQDASSHPIEINPPAGRRDTINSLDWVKLSCSSGNSAEISIISGRPCRTTPSSLEIVSSGGAGSVNVGQTDSPTSGLPSLETSGTVSPIARAPSNPMESALVDSGRHNQLRRQHELSNTTISQPGTDDFSLDQSDQNIEQDPNQQQQHKTSKCNILATPSDPSFIKFSKSDNSLIESFVLLGHSPGSDRTQQSSNLQNPQTTNQSMSGQHLIATHVDKSNQARVNSLERNRPKTSVGCPVEERRILQSHKRDEASRSSARLAHNHKWARELYLRAVLQKRRPPAAGVKTPAPAVTSLTISKDHKTLFVGDASGHITSWAAG